MTTQSYLVDYIAIFFLEQKVDTMGKVNFYDMD